MLSSQPEFQNLLLLHGRDRRIYKLKKELELIPLDQNRVQEQIGKEKLSIEIAINDWRELETKNNSLESEIISISDQVNRLKRQQLEVKKNLEISKTNIAIIINVDIAPVLPNSNVVTNALGISATIPAKIINEIPFPIPL